MIDLKDKKILILGASGNVGKNTAIVLSELGAKLVISGRDESKLKETLGLLQESHHRDIMFDVAQIDKIKDFLEEIVNFDGEKLSGIVYCAGLIPIRPIKSTTYDFLNYIMSVNFFAFAEFVKCFANNKNHEKNSSIVALSSYAAHNPDKGQLAYAASKGAINSSIVVMAKELCKKNIRVNALCPAVIAHEGMENEQISPETMQKIKQMGTGAIEPKNIAKQVAFLLSENSRGVTGRCFDIKGYLS